MCFLLKRWLKETCFFVCFLLKQTAVLSAISICTLHTREKIYWSSSINGRQPRESVGFARAQKRKETFGGGQQKLVSAGLTLRCDFSIPLPIIQTCSTTHVDTAHGSVSSGMFQTKITLFMFSNRLKFYTGMALVKMSIKSKVTVCSQSTYFLTGLIFSISITLCTQQANCGVTWKQC